MAALAWCRDIFLLMEHTVGMDIEAVSTGLFDETPQSLSSMVWQAAAFDTAILVAGIVIGALIVRRSR